MFMRPKLKAYKQADVLDVVSFDGDKEPRDILAPSKQAWFLIRPSLYAFDYAWGWLYCPSNYGCDVLYNGVIFAYRNEYEQSPRTGFNIPGKKFKAVLDAAVSRYIAN